MANDNSKIAIRTFITYNRDTGYIWHAIIQNIIESGTNYLEASKLLKNLTYKPSYINFIQFYNIITLKIFWNQLNVVD